MNCEISLDRRLSGLFCQVAGADKKACPRKLQTVEVIAKVSKSVTPTKVGAQKSFMFLDSGLRRNDENLVLKLAHSFEITSKEKSI